jgi:quinol monooxygenase YgiN
VFSSVLLFLYGFFMGGWQIFNSPVTNLLSRSGYSDSGEFMADVHVALWVCLDAKPGKEKEVADFLRSGLAIVQQEPATIAWFAIQMGPSSFGIFDAFPDEAGRQAHLTGKLAAALMAKAGDLLAKPPAIEKIDLLTAKLPG